MGRAARNDQRYVAEEARPARPYLESVPVIDWSNHRCEGYGDRSRTGNNPRWQIGVATNAYLLRGRESGSSQRLLKQSLDRRRLNELETGTYKLSRLGMLFIASAIRINGIDP